MGIMQDNLCHPYILSTTVLSDILFRAVKEESYVYISRDVQTEVQFRVMQDVIRN